MLLNIVANRSNHTGSGCSFSTAQYGGQYHQSSEKHGTGPVVQSSCIHKVNYDEVSFHQIFVLSPEDLISTFRVQRYQDECWQGSTGYRTAKRKLQNAFHGSKRSAAFFDTLASLRDEKRSPHTCSVDRIKKRNTHNALTQPRTHANIHRIRLLRAGKVDLPQVQRDDADRRYAFVTDVTHRWAAVIPAPILLSGPLAIQRANAKTNQDSRLSFPGRSFFFCFLSRVVLFLFSLVATFSHLAHRLPDGVRIHYQLDSLHHTRARVLSLTERTSLTNTIKDRRCFHRLLLILVYGTLPPYASFSLQITPRKKANARK